MGCFASKPKADNTSVTVLSESGPGGVSSSSAPTFERVLLKPNPRPLLSVYDQGRKLGEGAFGVATIVTNKESGAKLACKTISKTKLVSKNELEDIRKEVAILDKVKGHQNVVTLFDTFEDKDNVHLILELCAGGELFERIVAKGSYSEKDASALTRTMLEVIKHCNDQGIVHRDLKPENFLFLSPDEDSPLKVTDFGLSAFWSPGKPPLTDRVGTPFYVAPEVILGKYDEKCDVFSAGCIAYILLCGRPPFYGETDEQILRTTLNGVYDLKSEPWPSISNEAKELIQMMLQRKPKDRASITQLLQHPWIAKEGVASTTPIIAGVIDRMKKFNNMNKLKKKALLIMAENMREEELKELKDMFNKIDTDHSGFITFAEMKDGLKRIGKNMSDEQLEKIIVTYDVDGDGKIAYNEFIAATLNMAKLNTQENILKAFLQFDKDGDGSITADEVLEALKGQGMDIEKATAIVKEADTNGDGVISFEEFANMMRSGEPIEDPSNPLSVVNVNNIVQDNPDAHMTGL